MTAETTTREPYTVTTTQRMSNGGYHRCGKPNWWARVGSDFLSIPRTRGDEFLTFTVPSHLPAGTRIDMGAGSGKDGIRCHHIVR